MAVIGEKEELESDFKEEDYSYYSTRTSIQEFFFIDESVDSLTEDSVSINRRIRLLVTH